jgi:putative transposase
VTRQAQEFLFAYAFIYGHFRPWRDRMAASCHRAAQAKAFNVWQQETCVREAA